MYSNKLKKVKALVLFSGGLDSLLAAKILENQGVEVLALCMKSCFFDEEKARNIAEKNDIKLMVLDISREHLKIVLSPKHGYGKNMNPCIDCHSLMIKEAAKLLKKNKFDILATGEVLGQRPFSQTHSALRRIEKETGTEGQILRPLSAKILPSTQMEEAGLVDRERLLDIEGRSRKRQMELVERFGIKHFETPSGGCLLTEKEYSQRLKNFLSVFETITEEEAKFLKIGHHFLAPGGMVIVARNQEEGDVIEKSAPRKSTIIMMQNYIGPVALILGKMDSDLLKTAEDMVAKHSRHARNVDRKEIIFRKKII